MLTKYILITYRLKVWLVLNCLSMQFTEGKIQLADITDYFAHIFRRFTPTSTLSKLHSLSTSVL